MFSQNLLYIFETSTYQALLLLQLVPGCHLFLADPSLQRVQGVLVDQTLLVYLDLH